MQNDKSRVTVHVRRIGHDTKEAIKNFSYLCTLRVFVARELMVIPVWLQWGIVKIKSDGKWYASREP